MAYAGPSTYLGTLFVWGGGDYFNQTQYCDNWTWNPIHGWANIGQGTTVPPSFRLQAMFVYDDGTGLHESGIYLFGGTADYGVQSGSTFSALWRWN
jgi:hypothetical protein